MYFRDHPPPHFHALYGEHQATIDIEHAEVIEGGLPARALSLVREWAIINKEQLLDNWRLCQQKEAPARIAPLP
jgi:hypothetical protein